MSLSWHAFSLPLTYKSQQHQWCCYNPLLRDVSETRDARNRSSLLSVSIWEDGNKRGCNNMRFTIEREMTREGIPSPSSLSCRLNEKKKTMRWREKAKCIFLHKINVYVLQGLLVSCPDRSFSVPKTRLYRTSTKRWRKMMTDMQQSMETKEWFDFHLHLSFNSLPFYFVLLTITKKVSPFPIVSCPSLTLFHHLTLRLLPTERRDVSVSSLICFP
jgi:hypothetical protein